MRAGRPAGAARPRTASARCARGRGSTRRARAAPARSRRGRAAMGSCARTAAASALAEGRDAEHRRDAAAAGDVGLQHVDRARLEHAPEVVQLVAVLAGRDLHPRRALDRAAAAALRGRPRRPAPRTSSRRPPPGSARRARAPACGRRRRSRRRTARRPPRPHREPLARAAGRAAGRDPTFILTAVSPSPAHPAELVAQLAVVVGGEPAAAVGAHRGADAAEQRRDRHAQQPRLQVPQRDVERRDRARGDAGVADVAHGGAGALPRTGAARARPARGPRRRASPRRRSAAAAAA